MQNSLLSVIVPVYCNETTLRPLHARIKQVLKNRSHEILYVNDASPDDSEKVLSELAGNDQSVRVVTLSKNIGQNRAILEGLVMGYRDDEFDCLCSGRDDYNDRCAGCGNIQLIDARAPKPGSDIC